MSKIKIQGNSSGTGVVTLIAPNTNTDKTITLPDTTATLVGSDTAVVKDASGNVGIGISTPQAITHTVSPTNSTMALIVQNDVTGNSGEAWLGFKAQGSNDDERVKGAIVYQNQNSATGVGDMLFLLDSAEDNGNVTISQEAMRLDSAGNLGLGVTPVSSAGLFTAFETGAGSSFMGYNSTYPNTYIGTNVKASSSDIVHKGSGTGTGNKPTLYHQTSGGEHRFKVGGSGTADTAISWTTAMTIQNNGALSLSGATGDTSYGLVCTGTTNGNGKQILFQHYSTGNVVGSVTTSSTSTSYNTSSDYRLKENVVPMSGSIDRLKELKPSRFNFIADADTTVDGFLAHEAGEVVPECVSGEKDAMKMEDYEVTPAVMDGETVITEAVMGEREVPDMQGIDQSKLVPLLVGAIQELTARLEALEAN
jgi:hypothetical protein